MVYICKTRGNFKPNNAAPRNLMGLNEFWDPLKVIKTSIFLKFGAKWQIFGAVVDLIFFQILLTNFGGR